METKACSRCGVTKPMDEFYNDSRSPNRKQPRCKECQKELSRSWWKRNGKESYQNHKKQQRAWRKANQSRYAARERAYHLRRKYNMTEADFQALVLKQEQKCACCGTVSELVIDHCHARGVVRELLCQPCNKGLGCFFDDPAKLRLAAEYLEKHNEPKD